MTLEDYRFRDALRQYFTARRILYVLARIGLAVGAYRVVQAFTIERIAHAHVSVTPFTLKLDYYNFETNANGQYFTSVTKARRSDGATVEVEDVFGRNGRLAGASDRHIRMPDGESFIVHDFVAGVTKWPSPESLTLAKYKQWLLNPPADCIGAGETLSGYDTLLGQKVVILSLPSVKGGRITAWRAPGLLCEALRNQVQERQADGSLKVVSEGRPTALSLGDPNSALFVIPSHYAALKPSEALQKEAAALGITWTVQMQDEANRMDSKFSRVKRGN